MPPKVRIFLGVTIVLLTAATLLIPKLHHDPVPGSSLLVQTTPDDLMVYIRGLNSPLVVVNFWASWCEPCKKEFPSLLALRERLAPQGLKVVFVSLDEPRDFTDAEDFLKQNHVNFQTYYKGAQDLQFVNKIYPAWDGSIPATVLFGPKMQTVDAWEGDATLNEFQERILRHLKGT